MPERAAIEAAPLVRFLATAPGAYPALSALHVLGIALLVGPILLVDARALGWLGPALDPARGLLIRAALAGFALAGATGVMLASVRISEYVGNSAFQLKLLVLALAGLNAGAHHLARSEGARRATALASIGLWLGAIAAGRWIAFVV